MQLGLSHSPIVLRVVLRGSFGFSWGFTTLLLRMKKRVYGQSWGAIKGLWSNQWSIRGDFNVTRSPKD